MFPCVYACFAHLNCLLDISCNTFTKYFMRLFLIPAACFLSVIKVLKTVKYFCHRTFHPVTMIGCCHIILFSNLGNSEYPVGIYLFKRNNRNTRAMSEICSKSTIMTKGNCCDCNLNKYLPAEYLPKLNNYFLNLLLFWGST